MLKKGDYVFVTRKGLYSLKRNVKYKIITLIGDTVFLYSELVGHSISDKTYIKKYEI